MGRRLAERLEAAESTLRARGEKFILVTLTIDRSRFTSAGAAHSEVRQKRAVALAVSRWAKSRGVVVHWLAKLELQKAGWPHWHVLIAVPATMRIQLPVPQIGKGGEFDAFWQYGFSNVIRDGWFSNYAAKSAVVGYACKASGDGEEALEASELPAFGTHFLQPSHGFWAYVGVDPPHVRDARQYDDDDVVAGDDGECAGSTIGEKPCSPTTLAERVSWCGYWSTLGISGGMCDEAGDVGTRTGEFTVVLPMTRGDLGRALEQYFEFAGVGDAVFYDESPILERVQNVAPESVVGFFEWVAEMTCNPLWDDLADQVRARMGWLPPGYVPARALPLFSARLTGAGGGGATITHTEGAATTGRIIDASPGGKGTPPGARLLSADGGCGSSCFYRPAAISLPEHDAAGVNRRELRPS